MLQHPAGSMPAGRNGAYGDPETPVRATSHALSAFCSALRASDEARYKEAAEKALAYLLSVFLAAPGCLLVRHAKGKDHSNGVLGQAFAIEALHSAWRSLGREDARDAAIALIKRHGFDNDRQCWQRVTPAGDCINPDMTFNHQLYFAATASMFRSEDKEVARDLDAFLRGWSQTLQVRDDGRVVHEVSQPIRGLRIRSRLHRLKGPSASLLAKEADYHLYNCYGFALLARNGVDVPLVAGAKWPAIERFARSSMVQNTLQPDSWSAPLRSGTETRVADFLFFEQVFGDAGVDVSDAAAYLNHVLGPDRGASLLSPDPVTQKARAYRFWRLLESAA
jgi:hypothetical protein